MKSDLRKLVGGGVLLLIAGTVRADGGMPALLQFAEKYQRQSDAPDVQKLSPTIEEKANKTPVAKKKTSNVPHPPIHREGSIFTLRKDLLAREQQIARLHVELETLRQELTQLRAEAQSQSSSEKQVLPDQTALRQWVAGFRQAWRGSPDEQRMTTLINAANKKVEHANSIATLARQQRDAFKEQVDSARQALEQAQQKSQSELKALRLAMQDSEQKRLGQEAKTASAKKELEKLQQQQIWRVTTEQLRQNDQLRLSYAAGTALGNDIQELLNERKSWGLPVEKNSLLAGVIDSISGHLLLPQKELNTLKAQADSAAEAARQKQVTAEQRRGETYIAKFSKQKGVKKSPMGFWYRIDYSGKGALAKDAVVNVVVKEQLTNGSVIQDMELNGKVLSQPLSAYPPLFREAIGYLQDHGSITMVVPPELAYGETGYPPDVPPNATMIYELRIDSSHRQPDKSNISG